MQPLAFRGRDPGWRGPGSAPPKGNLAQSCPPGDPGTRFPERPDWPDPQSQSLSRSYGSRLPISLTHIVLSTRGCEPWRPDAEMGTVCAKTGSGPAVSRRARRTRVTSSRASFTGWRRHTGHRKNCGALRPPRGLKTINPCSLRMTFGVRGA